MFLLNLSNFLKMHLIFNIYTHIYIIDTNRENGFKFYIFILERKLIFMSLYALPREEYDRVMRGMANARMGFRKAYYTFCNEYSSWESNSKYHPKELMENSKISAFLESQTFRDITAEKLEKEISILHKLVYGPSDGVMWFQLLAEMDWPKHRPPSVMAKRIYNTIAKEFYGTQTLTNVCIFHEALYLLQDAELPPKNIMRFYAACDEMSETVRDMHGQT